MLELPLFIPKQLLNTLMLGFRQIRSLATSLKTTWIRLTVDLDDPNISPEFLDRLSYDKDVWVRCWVAHNPNTPPEALDLLSYDKEVCVRYGVARNPNTLPETLERLSYDYYYCVRRNVALNPNTPQYIKDHYKFRQFLKWHTDVPVT
jgi:hypothetical protein